MDDDISTSVRHDDVAFLRREGFSLVVYSVYVVFFYFLSLHIAGDRELGGG